MDLKTYIKTETGNASRLASELGIPLTYLSQMACGRRTVSPARAVAIRKATNGAVTLQELRPDDWQDIWPDVATIGMSSKKRKVIV